ncbi:MAG: hypothetical protein ACSLE5_15345 [Porticoccaceae bacterium]
MARPLKPVDWEIVDELCAIQCTGEEVAAVIGLNYDTLNRACKREKKLCFTDHYNEKSQHGKASLRRRQWRQAEEGNATMQIWLGKQWLGQSDNPNPPPTVVQLEVKNTNPTKEEIIAELKARGLPTNIFGSEP